MSDDAVSAVVGTMLVLGLVVGAMTVYQLTVVPNQKERAESNHMGSLAGDMAALDADLLEQVQGTSSAPLSSPVRLGYETPIYAPETQGTSTLSHNPGDLATTIASPSLLVVTRDGQPLLAGGDGDAWQPVQDGDTVENVTRLIGFRINLTDADPADDDRLRIDATDASGDYAGDLQAIVDVDGSDLDLILQTQEPPSPGTVIFHNHLLSIDAARWDEGYWLDALFDLYGFDRLVADADKPATLTFGDEGLDAEYKIAYEKETSGGIRTLVGAGEEIVDYDRTFPTGTLQLDVENEFYPDQEQTIEHGALVRSQADGAAFLVDPPLSASAGGEVVKLGLDVPALTGESDTVSEEGVATVRTRTTERETFGATAGELTLTWGTDHPAPWARFLEDELTDAGLTSQNCPPDSPDSDCQFEIRRTASSVTLDVHGPHATDADPSDPERDIFLDSQRGTIQTEVRS